MDADYLRQLADLLDEQASGLGEMRLTLRGHDARLSWTGSAAEAFAERLRAHGAICADRERDLRAAAAAMRTHAAAISAPTPGSADAASPQNATHADEEVSK